MNHIMSHIMNHNINDRLRSIMDKNVRSILYRSTHKSSRTMIPWSKQSIYNQMPITHANGCYIYNHSKEIMDFTSGLMVVNLGHNNKYIQEGFHQHTKTGIGFVNSFFETEEREKLSERLIDITNKNGKVFYTNGGADANETAMYIASDYHKMIQSDGYRILSFQKSFHGGSTIGASLISGDYRKKDKSSLYSLQFESIMPNPSLNDNGKQSLQKIERLFQLNDVAAILIEGSSGSAGCYQYPHNYLLKLEKICRDYNVLIICDEVMSGWCRTGDLFAYQYHKINPDIITTAKGITSGYVQLGAVVVSKQISSIYHNRPIMSGLTYFGHPLACTIANRCMDLYLENDQMMIKKVKYKGNYLRKLGKELETDINIVREFRNHGLLGCIDLHITDTLILEQISSDLLKNGVYCYRRQNMIFTAPPLIISKQEIYNTFQIIRYVLLKYTIIHN